MAFTALHSLRQMPVKWSTDLLRPLWRAALAEVIAARVMHLDGTGLTALDGKTPGNKKLGALWGRSAREN